MKSICKIHMTSLMFYMILILSGYINYLYFYLIIIFIHELGHIITIKLLKIKINSITIYPFGGVIDTNINYNINSNKYFLISISGVIAQILLFVVFNNYANTSFLHLNLNIIIFNLIPVYPSDGNKVLTSILERFISYKNVLVITNIISIISLFLLFIYSKNIFIFVILYYMNIKVILLFNYIFNKFILERYLYKNKYKKNNYVTSEKEFKKCRNNRIKYDNIYIEEEKYLNSKFGEIYWQTKDCLVSSNMFVSIHYKPH